MDGQEAIHILQNEINCTTEEAECDRHCGTCKYGQNPETTIWALRRGQEAIAALDKFKSIIKETLCDDNSTKEADS